MPYKYFRLKPINLKKVRHEAWIFLLPKRKDHSALVGKRADPVALLSNLKLIPKNDIFLEGQKAFINSKRILYHCHLYCAPKVCKLYHCRLLEEMFILSFRLLCTLCVLHIMLWLSRPPIWTQLPQTRQSKMPGYKTLWDKCAALNLLLLRLFCVKNEIPRL